MKKGLSGFVAAVIILLAPSILGGERKPIVVVFNMQTQRIKLSKSLLNGLSDYLATQLAGTGRFQVVPRDQLKKRLSAQKKKSFKQCYDQKCQIEMGRELAAEKTLSAQVIKFGKFCTVNVTLYDLKKAATESAASVKGKCGEEGLLESINKVALKLSGEKRKGGLEWLYSRPAGIEFTKTEVTVAQYRACVKAGKCSEPRSKSDNKYCNWGHLGRGSHPINCVEWKQAKSFCQWAGGRLPTEAEWEAEASNNGTRKYPWGDRKPTCDYAVMDQGGDGCGQHSTLPVCSKKKGNSVSGLCDMSGNLWEWTSSLYDKEHDWRVVRGGSRGVDDPGNLRASYRGRPTPAAKSSYLGFRCAIGRDEILPEQP